MKGKYAERLIVALDFSDPREALAMVEQLSPLGVSFKIGLELFMAGGPPLVAKLAAGQRIFLDLKFHDIPNTVAAAVKNAAALGVWMINVHAAGGRGMMAAAREAVEQMDKRPLVIAVTVLTSMSDRSLAETGYRGGVAGGVNLLSSLAAQCGLDGVVCSPLEVPLVKKNISPQFLTVSPGVRPAGQSRDDQSRVAEPAAVIRAGGDFLVVGRPITGSTDPLQAAAGILEEMGAL